MSQALEIAIIGLGQVGTSIGLALKQTNLNLHIVGHDKEPTHTRQAARMKAIDRGDWNLPRSVEKAALVILALPLHAIPDTLQYIADVLRPNAIVMDTASLKGPVLAWAARYLPDSVHFVGGHPIVRDATPGPENARADLFQGEVFCLCTTPRVSPQAVKLATDFVSALGATPLFLDPTEHDGLMAAVEHAPQVLAAALAQAVTQSPGWREMRKLAGAQFEASTFLSSRDPEDLAAQVTQNAEHILTWLQTLSDRLDYWYSLIDRGDHEAIAAALRNVADTRLNWLTAVETGNWEGRTMPHVESSLADWFFGRSFTRHWRGRRGEREQ